MRTIIIAIGVALISTTAASAQVNRDKYESGSLLEKPSTRYSPSDYRLPEYEPCFYTEVDSNGRVRMYNSQKEANRSLDERIRAEKVQNENMERFVAQRNADAEKRANDAEWKLGAIIVGLFIGFIRVIWGACSGSS